MSERHKPEIKVLPRRLFNRTTRRQSQLPSRNSRLQTWRREVRHRQRRRHSTSSNRTSHINNNSTPAVSNDTDEETGAATVLAAVTEAITKQDVAEAAVVGRATSSPELVGRISDNAVDREIQNPILEKTPQMSRCTSGGNSAGRTGMTTAIPARNTKTGITIASLLRRIRTPWAAIPRIWGG